MGQTVVGSVVSVVETFRKKAAEVDSARRRALQAREAELAAEREKLARERYTRGGVGGAWLEVGLGTWPLMSVHMRGFWLSAGAYRAHGLFFWTHAFAGYCGLSDTSYLAKRVCGCELQVIHPKLVRAVRQIQFGRIDLWAYHVAFSFLSA